MLPRRRWIIELARPIPRDLESKIKTWFWWISVLLWAVHSLGAVFYAFRGDPWSHGDWLISYEEGFIRRGFLGATLFAIADMTQIPVGAQVLFLQVCSAAVFYFGVAALLAGQKLTVGLVAMALIPMSFFYVLVDPASAGRKELLLFGLAILWQRLEAKRLRVGFLHIAMSLGVLFLILSHEGFVFYLPFLILISALSSPAVTWLQITQRALVLGVPSLLAVSFIALTESRVTADGLCQPLLEAGYTIYTCDGAVYLAAKSGPSGLQYAVSTFSNLFPNHFAYLLVGVIYVLLIWVCFSLILSKRGFSIGTKSVRGLAITALLCTIPIFLIAVDWGRYLQMALVLFSIAVLSLRPRDNSVTSERKSELNYFSKRILTFSVVSLITLGLSVSDAQYRSIIGNVFGVGYYLDGGLTPGLFD